MRKIIATALCVLMILSLAFVCVSAADPAPVASAEDFAAMAADGSYKLTADITLSATYATAFTGTLDGAGFKITTSVPVFATLTGATVKNLTIEGDVSDKGHVGALSKAGSAVTLENVKNNASVTTTEAAKYVGGLIGSVTTGKGTATAHEKSYFTNCTNNGTVSSPITKEEAPRLGGLVGNAAKYQFCVYTDCVNNGEVKTVGQGSKSPYVAGIAGSSFGGEAIRCVNNANLTSESAAHMGGIIGRCTPSTQGTDQTTTCTNCVNNGKLTCADNVTALNASGAEVKVTSGTVGGIIGHAGNSDSNKTTKAIYTCINCVNNGDIVCGGTQAGGIIGYVYGIDYAADKAYYQYGKIVGCTNKGNLTGTKTVAQSENGTTFEATFLSQFLGYANTESNVITDSNGYGKLTNTNANYNVIFGMSSCTTCVAGTEFNNIVLLKDDGTVNFNWCADGSALGDRADYRVSLADYLAKDGNAAKVTFVDSIPADDPGTTPVTPVTGDSVVWVIALSVVSVFGMALSLRTRKN